MRRPSPRPGLPARRSDNEKRRLSAEPEAGEIRALRQNVRYRGSPKHKLYPHLYGLEPFLGRRGDATLCDRDAGFRPEDMAALPGIIDRALRAGLVGEHGILWAIADNGWIYEARITNAGRSEYHGYPVRSSEAIAQAVYQRFRDWANNQGDERARVAAANCGQLYGFR